MANDLVTMRIVLCVVLCLCVAFSAADVKVCTNTAEEDSMEVEDTASCRVEFQLDHQGYDIEAKVLQLQLDSEAGSSLTLKPEHDEKEYKFVYNQEEPKTFVIMQPKVTLEFNAKSKEDRFSIHFQRHGALTTTEEPTTVVSWPTPVGNDSIYLTVNLSVSAQEYKQHEPAFLLELANITNIYCAEEDIILKQPVTTDNMHVSLTPCPVEWPRPPACVQLVLAVPVLLASSQGGYELRAEHLERLWGRYGAALLALMGWAEYEPPSPAEAVGLWLAASLAGLAIVLITAVVWACGAGWWARCCGNYSKRDMDDTEKIISTPQRVSDASLWPAARQEIPPLFDSERTYAYFEPDASVRGPHLPQHQHTPSHLVDDSSDEEILTVNGSSARTSFSQSVLKIDHDAYDRESAL